MTSTFFYQSLENDFPLPDVECAYVSLPAPPQRVKRLYRVVKCATIFVSCLLIAIVVLTLLCI